MVVWCGGVVWCGVVFCGVEWCGVVRWRGPKTGGGVVVVFGGVVVMVWCGGEMERWRGGVVERWRRLHTRVETACSRFPSFS